LLALLALIYFLTETLYNATGGGKGWKIGHRIALPLALLSAMLATHFATKKPGFDLLGIAHWAGIAYGIPRASSWLACRMENRLKTPGFLSYLSYMLYFPTFMQGPVMEADGFEQSEDEKLDKRKALTAAYLFFTSYCKFLFAVFIFFSRPPSFFTAQPAGGRFENFVFLLATPVCMYLFFASYTDLSRAVSFLLGRRTPKNFDAPFFSVTFKSFWRKYHISLTKWLREYVYIPLGGNRRRHALNVFAVYAYIAVWHNLKPGFLVWGATQGCAVLFDDYAARLAKRPLAAKPLAMSVAKAPLFAVRFAAFWLFQAFSWSFFYGGYDGALAIWKYLLKI